MWIDLALRTFSYLTKTNSLMVRPISVNLFLNYCSLREVNINRLIFSVYFFLKRMLNNKTVGTVIKDQIQSHCVICNLDKAIYSISRGVLCL